MIFNLQKFFSRESDPFVQFIKYGIAGGMATATNILVFFLCGWFLFPCLTQDDIVVKTLHLAVPVVANAEQAVEGMGGITHRALNAFFCFTIGFVVSNILCYLLNRLFVFKPGRHSWWVEFLLFFVVSCLSFAIGSAMQTFLISHFAVQTTLAFVANIVAALLINYAARKFFIFKG